MSSRIWNPRRSRSLLVAVPLLLLASCNAPLTASSPTLSPITLLSPWPPALTSAPSEQESRTSTPEPATGTPSPPSTPSITLSPTPDLPLFFREQIGFMYTKDEGWTTDHQLRPSDVYHTSDGGQHWTTILHFGSEGLGPVTRTFVPLDRSAAILLVTYLAPGPGGATEVEIQRTSDAGLTWDTRHLNALPNTWAIDGSFTDPEHGWLLMVVMDSLNHESRTGAVYRTTDGGLTWAPVSTFLDELDAEQAPGALPPQCQIGDILFSADSTGWVTGTCDPSHLMFYGTRDGGVTWTQQALPAPPGKPDGHFDQGVFYVDPPEFVTVRSGALFIAQWGHPGETFMYKTHDGGVSWTTLQLPGPVWRGWFDPVSDDIAWVTDGRALFMSHDGWQSWRKIRDKPGDLINQIQFVSEDVGWILLAGGEVQVTRDAGAHWETVERSVVVP